MIPKPNKNEVKKYLQKWDNTENYVLQEKSLNKLFLETYPNNNDISEILIKASTLNDFYSTHILSVFSVAKHIHSLDIDTRLKRIDETLVNDIADITLNGKKKRFYSFATKYCSHHFPKDFPIYDSYVEKVLMYFNKQDHFAKFKREELKEYSRFKDILLQFRKFYNLEQYNLKDIDRYIWQLGKETFAQKK
ncbi:MAG: hypothetical protein HFJ30_08830 [Clostridia bacterium]|jgi:hypothetical protein|nr:hypothetical protein [Clostridia bacterium]